MKSNLFSQREGFTSDYSDSDQEWIRGKNVVVNANIIPQFQ